MPPDGGTLYEQIHRDEVEHALAEGGNVAQGAPTLASAAAWAGGVSGSCGSARRPRRDSARRARESSALAVHLVDEGNRGHAVPLRLPPNRLGLRLRTRDRIHDQRGAIEHARAALDLNREVDVARRVNQVDGMAAPLKGGRSRLDGDATFALLLQMVHDGVSVVDAPSRSRHAGEQ